MECLWGQSLHGTRRQKIISRKTKLEEQRTRKIRKVLNAGRHGRCLSRPYTSGEITRTENYFIVIASDLITINVLASRKLLWACPSSSWASRHQRWWEDGHGRSCEGSTCRTETTAQPTLTSSSCRLLYSLSHPQFAPVPQNLLLSATLRSSPAAFSSRLLPKQQWQVRSPLKSNRLFLSPSIIL